MIRVRAGLSFVALGVVVLTGCTAPAPVPDPTVAVPIPLPTAGVHVPLDIPDGVVATGELRTQAGASLGAVEVSKSGGVYTVRLPTGSFGDANWFAALSDGAVPSGWCGENNAYQLALGAPEDRTDTFTDATGDPSYWRQLLIVDYRSGVVPSCGLPLVAAAELGWTSPATRPWLAVVDAGPKAAARGPVLLDGDRPVIYRVVAGDTWNAIADRFGMSADDLEFLNPLERRPMIARVSEILNLDPAGRSHSAERADGSDLDLSFTG